MSSYSYDTKPSPKLPLRAIPGDYGLPFFGAIKDRLDFFYRQGQDEFFSARIKKYNSTVFRANAPPGPFNAGDSKVIVLLDAVSFPILFDIDKVEKKDVFSGTYMPSTKFTGGYRVCSYLDPSETKHTVIKGFILSMLKKRHTEMIPNFRISTSRMFEEIEDELLKKGEADFNPINDRTAFDFLFRLFTGKSSYDTPIGGAGNANVDKWLFFQLAPLMKLGLKYLPNRLEDLLLHTFPLPYFVVKSSYEKFRDAFATAAGNLIAEAEQQGIDRNEAIHNLLFLTGFNAYGGTKIIFPALLKYIGTGGKSLHQRLAAEIRGVVAADGGKVTLSGLEKMSLTKSIVWETLRLEPPVAFQYGKAKVDITIASHDNSFEIKKGEMIFGYQPFAMKDSRVFFRAGEFVAERFVGEGEKLLKYVYWTNGRETVAPTVLDKQCPGKDLVVLIMRMMVVELFLRYDTFSVEIGTLLLGSSVKFTAVTKAGA